VSRDGSRDGLTRRQVLRGAGGVAALAIVGGGIAELISDPSHPLEHFRSSPVKPAGEVHAFRSEPHLRAPTVTTIAGATTERRDHTDPGFLFLGPGPVSLSGTKQYGPLIVDRRDELVWFRPVAAGLEVTNFTTSLYRGEPVLMWWEGKVLETGYGRGEAVLLNRSYREVARIRAVGGRSMDMHALVLSPTGTALFTCHPELVAADLSSLGGGRHAQVYESIIQEVDIATGRLLFEWRSLKHVPVSGSHLPLDRRYDYLHPNSIQLLPDGNLLVSARHTWAIYKLERRTGNVMWTLGGRHSDFEMAPGTAFAWQHDARQISDNVLTVFDNGSNGAIETRSQSRGLLLEIDESRRRVTLGKAYTAPRPTLSSSMGSVQVLPSGRVVVGWGVTAHTSEFAADGSLRFDSALPAGMYSYRSLWLHWQGTPHHRPAIAAARDQQTGTKFIYASWNGATDVKGWRVNAGSRRHELHPLGIALRRGFETAIRLDADVRFASVTALDHHGRPLKHSPTVKL
jgi:Arylsulfotransferase (ASST)